MEDGVLNDLVCRKIVGMVRRLAMGKFKNFVPGSFAIRVVFKDIPDDVFSR